VFVSPFIIGRVAHGSCDGGNFTFLVFLGAIGGDFVGTGSGTVPPCTPGVFYERAAGLRASASSVFFSFHSPASSAEA
jgi:hypothetical protein